MCHNKKTHCYWLIRAVNTKLPSDSFHFASSSSRECLQCCSGLTKILICLLRSPLTVSSYNHHPHQPPFAGISRIQGNLPVNYIYIPMCVHYRGKSSLFIVTTSTCANVDEDQNESSAWMEVFTSEYYSQSSVSGVSRCCCYRSWRMRLRTLISWWE